MASDADTPTTPAAEVKKWRADIDSACKRTGEEDYRKVGKRLWKMYHGDLPEEVPFNILFSNTEILLPALYGRPARPIVKPRFTTASPLAKAAADASTKMLMFLKDINSEEYDDLDTATKENVLDACVPGRGLMEFCYEGKTAAVSVTPGSPETSEQLVSECVYPETCLWNRYIFGYAKKWKDVPWLAFELYFDKDQATEEFGAEAATKMKYTTETDSDGPSKETPTREGDRKVSKVWKIWDKKSRQVLFISDSGYDDYLKREDDPYDLVGFFPVPKPLRLIAKSTELSATAPYKEYENQAKELNRLTTRINKLIDMLKVRGAYDQAIGAIEEALKKEDGDLVPTEEASTLSREGGLDKHIWLMPIEKVVVVVQQLYLARTNCKQTIYEIMGLADIMRGASQASETLGAQKLKAQFGSVRLKNPQKEVQRYLRDCFRIMLELAVNKFLPETWAKATGLHYLTDAQAQAAQIAVQQATATAAQSGQPAPALPPMPPKWSDVLALLKSDLLREYSIDIETNSTVDPDASDAKEQMAELMNAMSQFLNGVGPLVQEGILPIEAAKAMMLGVARQFEMGSEVEDYIRAMQPPPPKAQDNSAQMAAQQQLAVVNLEKQGLAQQLELEKKARLLDARDADLKIREAKVSASEELHRIQMAANKSAIANDHKTHLTNTKAVTDAGVLKVQQIAKEIDGKMKSDAQSRATEKAASDKVNAAQSQSGAQLKSLEGLLKELVTSIQAMTKATLTPKERKLVKGKDGKTSGMIESPVGG